MYRRRGKTEAEIESELASLDLELDLNDDGLPDVEIDQLEESEEEDDDQEEFETTTYKEVSVIVQVCSSTFP